MNLSITDEEAVEIERQRSDGRKNGFYSLLLTLIFLVNLATND